MLMKVGGGDPTHGPVGGIHWHMNVGNKVEYIATDEARQKIPWVRMTDAGRGHRIPRAEVHQRRRRGALRTDGLHGLPQPPGAPLPDAQRGGQPGHGAGQDRPRAAVHQDQRALCADPSYTNETQALQGIATALSQRIPTIPRIRPAIDAVQQIYQNNFFPEMKANWKVYPDNIGHKDWPGCFRCHDGQHKTADGKKTIKANDCNACHMILAQGSGAELEQLTPNGQKFKHPGDEVDGACNDCHTGGL